MADFLVPIFHMQACGKSTFVNFCTNKILAMLVIRGGASRPIVVGRGLIDWLATIIGS